MIAEKMLGAIGALSMMFVAATAGEYHEREVLGTRGDEGVGKAAVDTSPEILQGSMSISRKSVRTFPPGKCGEIELFAAASQGVIWR